MNKWLVWLRLSAHVKAVEAFAIVRAINIQVVRTGKRYATHVDPPLTLVTPAGQATTVSVI